MHWLRKLWKKYEMNNNFAVSLKVITFEPLFEMFIMNE